MCILVKLVDVKFFLSQRSFDNSRLDIELFFHFRRFQEEDEKILSSVVKKADT